MINENNRQNSLQAGRKVILLATLLLSVFAGALVISCGNPIISDLIKPLEEKKEREREEKNKPHPSAADFTVTGLSQIFDGSPKAVSITPQSGKSGGAITVYYEGTNGTSYAKSVTAPSAIGWYAVTFDVTAAEGWNAASGLAAGTLEISEQTVNPENPQISDFYIKGTGTVSYDGSPKTVTVTSNPGKSEGKITVWYEGTGGTVYNRSMIAPTAVGSYTVTFDIEPSLGWNAAKGFEAGTLTIENQTPSSADFNISGLFSIYDGSPKAVNITPKQDKSEGKITVYYDGSTTIPSAIGSYTVTFDVAAAEGWNAASGLEAGTLTIVNPTFNNVNDFESWLTEQDPNTAANPYTVVLNDITDGNISGIKTTLSNASDKYVILDLSGSNITSIPTSSFYNGSSPPFGGCVTLVGIIIPDTVTSIGNNAFQACTSLTSVTIGNKVNSIGDYAFYNCVSLTSVIIPDSVTSIGGFAFYNCNSLTSVTIGNHVTSIEGYAFSACTSLTSVSIGNRVTSIEGSAFSECTSLASVTIPDSVKSINWYAFHGCTSLTSVTFETGSNIADADFGGYAFPEGNNASGDALKNAYIAASPKEGTYIWASNTWTKI